ncbi:hypothetical protein CSA_004524 [Cucumis sativus]|uniref:Uncharacterized protein n=1 Tax=Cucumis sativus TaxID=3659 RepID=A0ACB6HBT4_CUCSA|nr:hypothetical protein CSA_004524 [Cucumis sativus]
MGSTEEKTNYLSDEEIPLKSSPVAKNVLHSFDCETAAVRSSPDTRWWKTSNIRIRPLRSAYIVLVRAKINVLLPFGPLAILLHYLTGKHFYMSGMGLLFTLLGITPLAERLGYATDCGLLNATFGNATEMIISIYALKSGMIRVVQQSLLGSILSNMLLCAWLRFFTVDYSSYKVQVFNKHDLYGPLTSEDDSEIYAWEAIGWLAILTVWVSVLSGYLVDAIQDITLGVAIGSSTQISMFVIPFCVVVGWCMGKPMDLNFKLFETATLFITVLVVAFMLQMINTRRTFGHGNLLQAELLHLHWF